MTDHDNRPDNGLVRIIFWILTVPFLAAAGAFAAANHQPLTLKLWPFPFEAEVPVYAAVLGAFFLGLLASALWFWTADLRDRLARRRQARREQALALETARLRRELAASRQGRPDGAQPDDGKAHRLIAAGGGE